MALKIEKHLKQPLTRRFPSQAEETPLRKIDLRAPTMQPNYKVNATIGDQRKEGKDHLLSVGKRDAWHGNAQRRIGRWRG